MKLIKREEYAVLFALHLVGKTEPVTVKEAVHALGIPFFFLEQIARDLRRAGVTRVVKGPKGGNILLGDPTVAEVLLAVEADLEPQTSSKGSSSFPKPEHQALDDLLGALYQSTDTELQVTLSKLLGVSQEISNIISLRAAA